MDPFTALSLASSVAQLIDFGSKVILNAREIAHSGSSVSVEHLSIVTKDLVEINSSLEQQLKSRTDQGISLMKEEQALHNLTGQCREVADELIDCLDKLKLQSHKTDRWASFRAALKTIWSKERIDNLTRRLSDFREQLALRVLLLLNAYYALHNEKLELLQKGYKEIVEVVSINCGSLGSMIQDYHERRDEWQQDDRADAERRHSETLAAILTTRDGDCRTITGPHYSAEFATQSSTDSMQTATTYKQASQTGNQSDGKSPDFETTELTNFTTQIVDALQFRNITDRFMTVAKAYQKTFQWIYRGLRLRGRRGTTFQSGCNPVEAAIGSQARLARVNLL
ncbi:hypothetical protein MMC30_009183 [Trapelia coarctata]|nr:hypothetical protein [Trapelia coarctata]